MRDEMSDSLRYWSSFSDCSLDPSRGGPIGSLQEYSMTDKGIPFSRFEKEFSARICLPENVQDSIEIMNEVEIVSLL
ncbi:hypothetical protein M9Y10_005294 [Tritrichomonas musculus]|uniref:Uncharacterized protein n=1 Tax=Tritrichomonas musculus TaxID=1915356 RepID=A0ABR2JL09_9EUKA